MAIVPQILNGNATQAVPWLVLIKHQDRAIGTGFVLNENKVLTAASVVKHHLGDSWGNNWFHSSDLTIVAGVANFSGPISSKDVYTSDYTKIHPDFNSYRIENGSDVAIVRLKKPLDLQKRKIELACLGLDLKRTTKTPLICTGYGMTKEDGERQPSKVARYAIFKQVQDKTASGMIIGKPEVQDVNICDFDYGAPLHKTVGGIARVVGIASYTTGGHDADGSVSYCSGNAYFTKLSNVT